MPGAPESDPPRHCGRPRVIARIPPARAAHRVAVDVMLDLGLLFPLACLRGRGRRSAVGGLGKG